MKCSSMHMIKCLVGDSYYYKVISIAKSMEIMKGCSALSGICTMSRPIDTNKNHGIEFSGFHIL